MPSPPASVETMTWAFWRNSCSAWMRRSRFIPPWIGVTEKPQEPQLLHQVLQRVPGLGEDEELLAVVRSFSILDDLSQPDQFRLLALFLGLLRQG
jgi:hypothetical protein